MSVPLIVIGIGAVAIGVYALSARGKFEQSRIVRLFQRTPLGRSSDYYERWNTVASITALGFGATLTIVGLVIAIV